MPDSLFLVKLQAPSATLLKKENLAQVFSGKFCEISKNTFFTEHHWATASSGVMVIVRNFEIHIILDEKRYLVLNSGFKNFFHAY